MLTVRHRGTPVVPATQKAEDHLNSGVQAQPELILRQELVSRLIIKEINLSI
jgi:hypothetical protein